MINATTVDSSLMRLARDISLPIENAVTIWDVLDREINIELKEACSTTGDASRPAITTAAVAKTIAAWAANVENSILEGADQGKIFSSLQGN